MKAIKAMCKSWELNPGQAGTRRFQQIKWKMKGNWQLKEIVQAQDRTKDCMIKKRWKMKTTIGNDKREVSNPRS